ncbi:hypothetical protein B296_00032086 [Ensete ventricosum]|uniref:Uncharacterized protein n=1 Tax=Ensete ventricosum TaxID=4639 RepID=A0A427AC98_ENSVE|nr:hypothetical protein B296_00032086 [Ensete ventricosum]
MINDTINVFNLDSSPTVTGRVVVPTREVESTMNPINVDVMGRRCSNFLKQPRLGDNTVPRCRVAPFELVAIGALLTMVLAVGRPGVGMPTSASIGKCGGGLHHPGQGLDLVGEVEKSFDGYNRWIGVCYREREPQFIKQPLVVVRCGRRHACFLHEEELARSPDLQSW